MSLWSCAGGGCPGHNEAVHVKSKEVGGVTEDETNKEKHHMIKWTLSEEVGSVTEDDETNKEKHQMIKWTLSEEVGSVTEGEINKEKQHMIKMNSLIIVNFWIREEWIG